MSKRRRRVFSREFKLSVVQRILAGEEASALSHEHEIPEGHFHRWCRLYRLGGPQGLRKAGRPRKDWTAVDPAAQAKRATDLKGARKQICELERKVGQQQVELDFFRQALRQVRATRQPSDGLGGAASTRSSKR